MSDATLLLGAALDALSLALYWWAGQVVLRTFPRDASRATDAFSMFWYGVGLVNGLQALLNLVAVVRDPGVALAFAFWNTRIALALFSFAGLSYYLLFVYTGKRWLQVPVVVFYIGAFFLMQTWLELSDPARASVEAWRVGLSFEHVVKGPIYLGVVLSFFLPPLLASGAYALILRVTREPLRRYRIGLVSASLLVYFAGLTLGYLNLEWFWWGLVENLLGIGAAAAVLLALRPPAWALRRLQPPAATEAP